MMDQRTPEAAGDGQMFAARRDPRNAVFAREFLDALVGKAVLDASAAERALQAQRQSGQRIDFILTELGLVSAAQLLSALSHIFDIPLVTSTDFPSEPILPEKLASEFLIRNRVVPLAVVGNCLMLATSDAFGDDTARAIAYFVDLDVETRLASTIDIDAAIRRLYKPNDGQASDKDESAVGLFVNEEDLQRLKDIASEAPVIRCVNRVIASAVSMRASDIHIEPMIDALRVRFRIDGLTVDIERLSPEMQAGVASRIKILSKLNIAERRLPQDGRAKFVVSGREMDLRVSITPVLYGESIVIRILDQQELEFTLPAIGFEGPQAQMFAKLLEQPNGIILVTGPTGSGKTTTLYTALKILNSVERTIFSVEDPIEYQLPGINQMQIKPGIGLDFVNCLRSILRQDPDVIMIGEMRDAETVRVGIQASLTGHLVLSTLHTNSAAASITRLLDMGAQDYLLGSTLNAVIAQRLVRKLCTCARDSLDSAEKVERLAKALPHQSQVLALSRVKEPVGCPSCSGTGYKGRTSLVEMLVVDQSIRNLMRAGVQDKDIEAAARIAGMETLFGSGIRKVLDGQTSLSEVLRVVGV
jgi:general secretion pathway protein E